MVSDMDESLFKRIEDEDGFIYEIEKKLGKGGQGAVYKIRGHELAVKVVLDASGKPLEDEKAYKSFRRKIEEIMVLDLPEDVHIALPKKFLKPPMVGYIMPLMGNMHALNNIMHPEHGESIDMFYRKTGGLKRRMQIANNLAKTLEQLHSRAIVYADLSPNNIYISESVDETEVWLIDSDNMRYTVDFNKKIYTEGYAAPEVYTRERNNDSFSDSFSYAVIVFQLFSLQHPFFGKMITNPAVDEVDEEDEWEASAKDPQKEALKGNLPWVMEEGGENALENNLFPSGCILYTKGMKKLFDETFGYEGRKNPTTRPNMHKWYEATRRAKVRIVTCECGNSFYYRQPSCPFCSKKRDKVIVLNTFRQFSFAGSKEILQELYMEIGESSREISNERIMAINKEIQKRTNRIIVLDNLKYVTGKEDIKEESFDIKADDAGNVKFEEKTSVIFSVIRKEKNKYHINNRLEKNIWYRSTTGDIFKLEPGTKYKFNKLDDACIIIPIDGSDMLQYYFFSEQ